MKIGKQYLFEVKRTHPGILLSPVNEGAQIVLTSGLEKMARLNVNLLTLLEKTGLALAEGAATQNAVTKPLLQNLFTLFYTGQGEAALKRIIQIFNGKNDSPLIDTEAIETLLTRSEEDAKHRLPPRIKPLLEEMEGLMKSIDPLRSRPGDNHCIPFLFDGEAGVASLSNGSPDSKTGEGGHETVFTLNVELSVLGQVETTVKLTSGGMIILFRADRQETLALIREHSVLFKEAMAAAGMTVRHLEAYEMGKVERLSFVEPMEKENESVDLTV